MIRAGTRSPETDESAAAAAVVVTAKSASASGTPATAKLAAATFVDIRQLRPESGYHFARIGLGLLRVRVRVLGLGLELVLGLEPLELWLVVSGRSDIQVKLPVSIFFHY